MDENFVNRPTSSAISTKGVFHVQGECENGIRTKFTKNKFFRGDVMVL